MSNRRRPQRRHHGGHHGGHHHGGHRGGHRGGHHHHDHDPRCLSCADPEAADKQLMDLIIEHGHAVQYVFTDENSAPGDVPFFYSVGRTLKDRPEILVTGRLAQESGMHLVNAACRLDDQGQLHVGEVSLGGNFPVRVIEADPLAAQMFAATSAFGADDVTALQVIWPDKTGRFPDDHGYVHVGRYRQPLYPAA